MGEGIKLRRSVFITLFFVILIWSVKLIEFSFGYDFGQYGIFPRTLSGSVGIFTAPLIHGDMYHLVSNTLPILILGVGLFYFYDKIAGWVVLLIYLITGFWVWIAARDAYHIGASGIVYGLLTFLLFSGFLRRDSSTLAISFIVLFIYGGTLVSGMVPVDSGISWESHLMGAVAGVFCAVYFRRYGVKRDEIEQEPFNTGSSHFTYYYKSKQAEDQLEAPQKSVYIITYKESEDK